GADEHPPGLLPEMGAAGPDQVPARGAQGARLELQMGQVHLDASQAGGGVDVVADVAGGDDGDADAGMGGGQVDVGPGAGDVLQVQLDAAVAGAGPQVAPPAGQLDAAVGGAEGGPGANHLGGRDLPVGGGGLHLGGLQFGQGDAAIGRAQDEAVSAIPGQPQPDAHAGLARPRLSPDVQFPLLLADLGHAHGQLGGFFFPPVMD